MAPVGDLLEWNISIFDREYNFKASKGPLNPLVNDHIAGWNIPIFLLLKYIGSFRGPHFPATAMLDAPGVFLCNKFFSFGSQRSVLEKFERTKSSFLKPKKSKPSKILVFFCFHPRIPAHHVIHISRLKNL